MFRNVARANRYAPACAAVFRLAGELLKLGQTTVTVTHDVAWLVRNTTRALDDVQVCEIVMAARQFGGVQ